MFLTKILVLYVFITYYIAISFGANYIHGGLSAAPGQFPFMVSIRTMTVTHCGGGILNKRWIITDLQCIGSHISLIYVTVGSIYTTTGGVVHEVAHTELMYNTTEILIQFALLKLKKDIQFNKNTQPITIREKPLTADLFPLLNLYSNNSIFIGW